MINNIRGLIAINFIKDDNEIINTTEEKCPHLIYYSGKTENIESTILDELKNYIDNKILLLNNYLNVKISYISYYSDDDNKESEETITKGVINIKNAYQLNDKLIGRFLKEILTKFVQDDSIDFNMPLETIITQIINNGINKMTLVNFVRKHIEEFSFEDRKKFMDYIYNIFSEKEI